MMLLQKVGLVCFLLQAQTASCRDITVDGIPFQGVDRTPRVHSSSTRTSTMAVAAVTCNANSPSVDSTAAVQTCVSDCLSNLNCSRIEFAAGTYLISNPILFDHDTRPPSSPPLSVTGWGRASIFLWGFDGNLFEFLGAPGPTEAGWDRIVMENIVVETSTFQQSGAFAAINFTTGLTQSLISNIVITPHITAPTNPVGGIDLGPLSDTITVDNCFMEGILGTGLKIGRGSEVRLKGGRICGGFSVGKGLVGIGVHVTGNNGGVHIIGTDLIGHNVGLQLDDSSGAGSNREIFLSQATLDSNYRGLVVMDNSYVDISGCWAASSAADNIWVGPGRSALLAISGGTIFNGGHQVGDNATSNGMTVLSGSFTLTGVIIRNNKGIGLHVASEFVQDYTISGCKFYANNVAGVSLLGDYYSMTGSVFRENGPNVVNSATAKHAVIANNVGCCS
eukprot:m.14260 g.14260  ORF g.14260 m.14260 type:complete len:449 (-) comp10065_c0_seq1:132-1478(-)